MNKRELIVDSFAGGGGASLGIMWATGREPDVAINHNAAAIAMHAANHPKTRHFTEDVFRVDPREVTGSRPVGLLWASPDCKHFSRAKGGKPVEKRIRGLAWVVVKWATEVKPRVIVLENVREFQDWGPLLPRWDCPGCKWKGTEGQAVLCRGKRACPRCDSKRLAATVFMVPDPAKRGITFRQFVGRLKARGYAVAWKVLNAADFGAPTHRRRLFLIARNDGLPIEWPEPTHGDPKKIGEASLFEPLKPWRTAAECIDWSIPCPSIFDRKKPLAEKTLRRIAMGVKRYVLDNPRPFIVRYNTEKGAGDVHSKDLGGPLNTVTADPRFAIVTPIVSQYFGGSPGSRSKSPTEPLPTVTADDHNALITPVVVPVTHAGERRVNSPEEPLATVTGAHRGELSVVAPVLVPRNGERPGQSPRCGTVESPMPTVIQTANGATLVAQTQVVAANLVHLNHGEKQWSGAEDPMRTVTTGNHAALVYSFLVKYFGTAIGQEVDGPLHTVTGKARFGLVTASIDGEPYVIVDIGMRMLKPRELARAQGFPDDYILTGTNTNQVERIGNSVCPNVAKAIVEANFVREAAGVRR